MVCFEVGESVFEPREDARYLSILLFALPRVLMHTANSSIDAFTAHVQHIHSKNTEFRTDGNLKEALAT